MPANLLMLHRAAVLADVIEPTPRTVSIALAAAKFVMDAGLIVTSGLVIVAIAMVNRAGVLSDDARTLLRLSRSAAAITAVTTAVFAYATAADVMAVGLSDVLRHFSFLESLLSQTTLGHALLWQMGLLLGFGLLCGLITRVTTALLLLPLLVAVIIARANTGHSGNSAWHMAAIEAWTFHLAALCVWIGVVAVVALRSMRQPRDMTLTTLQRLNVIIRVCMLVVLLSGSVSAVVRLNQPADLLTSHYGLVLTAKIVLSLALVMGFGRLLRATARNRVDLTNPSETAKHSIATAVSVGSAIGEAVATTQAASPLSEPVERHRSNRGDTPNSARLWLRVHLLGLAAVTVLGVALSRIAPPFDPDAGIGGFSPLRQSLGFPPPPPPTASNLLWTQGRPDVFWLFIAIAGITLYVSAVRTLRTRAVAWSPARSASWIIGWCVVTYATSGPLGVYGHIFFSAHMAQHLLLVMVAPLLLVGGAPITLALRALPANRSETGAREWLLALLHSRVMRVASQPLVSFVNFVGGFFVLYFSGAFEALMRSHAGHLFMQVHFLASGYLFFLVVMGSDPAPRQLPAPARAGLALIAAPFHAVFSVIVMQGNEVLARDYFSPLAAAYRIDPLHDQYVGSSLGWAFGEVPMIVAIVIAGTRWVRADAREAARFDRWDDERRAREAANSSATSATE